MKKLIVRCIEATCSPFILGNIYEVFEGSSREFYYRTQDGMNGNTDGWWKSRFEEVSEEDDFICLD